MGMEFGVIARYFPENGIGLMQTNREEVIFFRARDAHYLMLDLEENRIIFSNRHDYIPREGDLVVFERAKYYGNISGIEYRAQMWGKYASWLVFHASQMFKLKQLLKEGKKDE